MAVMYLLLPLAILLVAGFVWAFIWATRHGQFDDVTTPQIRVVFDDEAGTRGEAGRAPVDPTRADKERS